MLERFRWKPDPAIQAQIDAVHKEMTAYGPDSPEYPKFLEQLERLEKVKVEFKPKPIDRTQALQTTAMVLLGVGMLVYEKTGVITSKVQALVVRPMR
jgi:hypothetical protein